MSGVKQKHLQHWETHSVQFSKMSSSNNKPAASAPSRVVSSSVGELVVASCFSSLCFLCFLKEVSSSHFLVFTTLTLGSGTRKSAETALDRSLARWQSEISDLKSLQSSCIACFAACLPFLNVTNNICHCQNKFIELFIKRKNTKLLFVEDNVAPSVGEKMNLNNKWNNRHKRGKK